MLLCPVVLHYAARLEAGVNAYWCCTAYPNDGGLLGVELLPVNVDTLLQVQQQGQAGHEGEHDVQAETEGIHLCLDREETGGCSGYSTAAHTQVCYEH